MNISKVHVPDCPQFWSLLSPLSAHQLPEINIYILLSTLFTYIKQCFFHNTTFYNIHCITLTATPGSPISPLSPFSPVAPGSPLSPFSPFEPCIKSDGQDIKSRRKSQYLDQLTIHYR